MINPKVYIISKGVHDYSKAESFGKLIYLSEGILNPYKLKNLYRLANQAMKDSSPDDYILLTGLPSLQIIACSYFVNKHGRLNLLVFREGEYQERTLVFEQ